MFSRIKETLKGKGAGQGARLSAQHSGGFSPSRFYGQKFPGGLHFPSPSLLLDSEQARLQARALSHSSLQMRALMERDLDTVIAQGLSLAPEPKHGVTGMSPEKVKEWASDVKTRFELWSMDQRASRDGRHNFFQAQRLMYKNLRRDGELFVMLSYHSDPSLLSPLRFQILDPSQIRENGYTDTGTGFSLDGLSREGVIRNEDGEEKAYKVWQRGAGGIPKMIEVPRIGRSGRAVMLHAVTGNDYAGQARGVSPYAGCIQDLENITNFTLAQVNKAINQSNIVFTGESETEEPFADPFKSLNPLGAGPSAKGLKGAPSADPSAGGSEEEPLELVYEEYPRTVVSRPGSAAVFSLKGRQKLKPFPDSSPSQSFNSFTDSYFAYIAASQGQSIETALMRFNQNYSASRASLILTWRAAVQRRWEFDYYIAGPVYEMWLSEEIAAGRVKAPGWEDPRIRAGWVSHRFLGLSMPNIDPAKTARAAMDYLSLGGSTLEDTAVEYNDSDAESNRIKLKGELEELRKIGPMPWAQGKAEGGKEKEKEEEEE